MRNVFAIAVALTLAVIGFAGAVASSVNGDSGGATQARMGLAHRQHDCGQFTAIRALANANGGGHFFIVGPIQEIGAGSLTVKTPLGLFDFSLAGHEDLAGKLAAGDIVMIEGTIDDAGAFTIESAHQLCQGAHDDDEEPTAEPSETPAPSPTAPTDVPTGTPAVTDMPTETPVETAAADVDDEDEGDENEDEGEDQDKHEDNDGHGDFPWVNVDFHETGDFHFGDDHNDDQHDKSSHQSGHDRDNESSGHDE